MQVIWQYEPSLDTEWPFRAGFLHRFTQKANLAHKKITAATRQVDREEHGRADGMGAKIGGHAVTLNRSG
ncbi:MAG: hypothetical protein R3256_08285 [Thalassovita sp.]|nr:hypothetical protein [Thalassovita sp.]